MSYQIGNYHTKAAILQLLVSHEVGMYFHVNDVGGGGGGGGGGG